MSCDRAALLDLRDVGGARLRECAEQEAATDGHQPTSGQGDTPFGQPGQSEGRCGLFLFERAGRLGWRAIGGSAVRFDGAAACRFQAGEAFSQLGVLALQLRDALGQRLGLAESFFGAPSGYRWPPPEVNGPAADPATLHAPMEEVGVIRVMMQGVCERVVPRAEPGAAFTAEQ